MLLTLLLPSISWSNGDNSQLLQQCNQYFHNFHLTMGINGQTAFECYKRVLKKSPNNIHALFGLEKIEIYYFARIKAASDKGLQAEARLYTTRLRKINPNSTYLAVFSNKNNNQQTQSNYYNLIKKAANLHKVPVALIQSVIEVESSYDSNAVSSVGAIGLMQLMPKTATWMGIKDSYDPADNINGGTKYLRYLLDMHNQNIRLALASYNVGPTAIKKKYNNTVPNFAKGYVNKIINLYNERTRNFPASARYNVEPISQDKNNSISKNQIKPIDNLFKAWKNLDLELYMQQWSKNATQTFGNNQRFYSDIRRKRAQDFKKYATITASYTVKKVSIIGTETTVIIKYNMSFTYKNGQKYNEQATEKYILIYSSKAKRWLIKENSDYFK
ncbi:MAG: lytic transglycosylase domain-containing protein [Thiomargarita sp.]|nr:lytic transglycosylase domain-containing protein [Thiomargarita sp.]